MRAAAVLLALAANGAAWAGPTIEIEPRTQAFASRAACEQALEQRHSAALSRLAALDRKGANKVTPLKRDGEQLSYAERVDLGAGDPDSGISDSQTEQFTCRGNLLEHRIDFGAGG
jgi:hypothetical protein